MKIKRITKLKFRVWNREDNKFVRGFEEIKKFYHGFANDNKDNTNFIVSFWNQPEGYFIIQRAVELKDKNGKEIFEGDILGELFDGEWVTKGVVEYDDGRFYLFFPNEGIVGEFTDCIDCDSKDLVILGNIFENKNLLKIKY